MVQVTCGRRVVIPLHLKYSTSKHIVKDEYVHKYEQDFKNILIILLQSGPLHYNAF